MPRKRKARKPSLETRLITSKVTELDPDGVRVVHHRVVDTFGRMREAGTITPEMHDAARNFQTAFTIACLDNMPKASLVLVHAPGTNGRSDFTDAQVAAREKVSRGLSTR